MTWVLASDAAWFRLPETKLGSGHPRALRNLEGAYLPGKYWIDWDRRWRCGQRLLTLQPPPQSVAFRNSPGVGCSSTLAPTLHPNLTQSLNGPDGPVAVGFGEAWQQVGTLCRGEEGRVSVKTI